MVKKKIKSQAARTQLVDRITLIASIAGPIITLPQIYDIYNGKSAAGVSVTAWIGFEILTLIWIWYAIVHKNFIILIGQVLYVFLQLVIIIGALMYGGGF